MQKPAAFAAVAAIIVCVAVAATSAMAGDAPTGPARRPADVTRADLIEQMKENCYTNNANSAPSEKAKCECLARTFVGSLTQGEIAVPKKSATINAKIAAARQACHIGE